MQLVKACMSNSMPHVDDENLEVTYYPVSGSSAMPTECAASANRVRCIKVLLRYAAWVYSLRMGNLGLLRRMLNRGMHHAWT